MRVSEYQRGWADAIAALRANLPGMRMHLIDLDGGRQGFALEESILDRALDNVLEDGVPGSVEFEWIVVEVEAP